MKSITYKIISSATAMTIAFTGLGALPTAEITSSAAGSVAAVTKTKISKCSIKLSSTALTYTGKKRNPLVTIKKGSVKLVQGRDYTLKYTNNVKIGTATVKITGKGKYSGTVTKKYKIQATLKTNPPKASSASGKISLSWAKVSKCDGYVLQRASANSGKYTTIYKGKKNSYSDSKVASGAGYKYRVGTYKKVGKKTYYYYSSPTKIKAAKCTPISKCSVTLSSYSRVYNGKNQQPLVTVKYAGKKLVQGKDYKVKYSNQKNVGTAAATITGVGKFSGTVKKTYKITAFDSIKDPTAQCTSGSVTVKWKAVPNATGYIVQRLKSDKKTYETIGKTSALKFTDKNLKEITKYTYRYCPYRIINGKTYYAYSAPITKRTLAIDNADHKLASEALTLINQERQKKGLCNLTYDFELNDVALTRAKEIANKYNGNKAELSEADHYYSDTKKYPQIAVYYLLEDNEFDFCNDKSNYKVGENLASGQTDAQSVVDDWMASPKHYANITDKQYTRTGIISYTPDNGTTTYWVQIFGS